MTLYDTMDKKNSDTYLLSKVNNAN
jgi:hypothetical protein